MVVLFVYLLVRICIVCLVWFVAIWLFVCLLERFVLGWLLFAFWVVWLLRYDLCFGVYLCTVMIVWVELWLRWFVVYGCLGGCWLCLLICLRCLFIVRLVCWFVISGVWLIVYLCDCCFGWCLLWVLCLICLLGFTMFGLYVWFDCLLVWFAVWVGFVTDLFMRVVLTGCWRVLVVVNCLTWIIIVCDLFIGLRYVRCWIYCCLLLNCAFVYVDFVVCFWLCWLLFLLDLIVLLWLYGLLAVFILLWLGLVCVDLLIWFCGLVSWISCLYAICILKIFLITLAARVVSLVIALLCVCFLLVGFVTWFGYFGLFVWRCLDCVCLLHLIVGCCFSSLDFDVCAVWLDLTSWWFCVD